MYYGFYRKVFILLIFLVFCVSIFEVVLAEELYDIVIENGRVIDPETERDENGVNIGIKGRQIIKITKESLSGKRAIDATGLVVAPGFIDPLSYDPNPVGSWYKLADGVTTNLALHGGSVSPAEYFEKHNKIDPPINYGTSFFVAKMRSRMQPNPYRTLTDDEIKRLVEAAENGLEEGAMAISFSLEYYPGTRRDEIIPLMKLAAEYNVPVFFHLRYSTMYGSGGNNIDGINEVLDYARETGAAIHIDHINSTGGTFSMEESLALLRKAREEGLKITACTYPYNYWATRLSSARFDAGWQKKFQISYDDLQLIGYKERITEKAFKKYRAEKGVLAVAYAIPEEDVVRSLKEDYIMVGSDGMIEPDPHGGPSGMNNHPRGAGNFSRVIARYVREQNVISLMEAVKKMTLLPAQLLEEHVPALRKKGRIQEGMDADIVIFDFDEIQDKADVINPAQYSEGIYYVLVNGQVVIDEEGIHQNVRVGEVIRSVFASESEEYKNMISRSLLSQGNNQRLKKAIEKAERGEDVTIAFIGGSVTQGAGASPINTNCYAYQSYLGFREMFGKESGENVHFIKAGVGGTSSELGIIRYERDVLRDGTVEPDIVVVEFAVNDLDDETKGVCFESLVLKILSSENKPAVVLLFSVFESDWNLQDRLAPVGKHYNLPMVSIKDAVVGQFRLPKNEGNVITKGEFFADAYHPTNEGHKIMADCLTYLFSEIKKTVKDIDDINLSKEPLIGDCFKDIHLLDRKHNTDVARIDEGGFNQKDHDLQRVEMDDDSIGIPQFPNNWMHSMISGNESFKMNITSSSLVLVYKDSGSSKFGKAEVFVDGKHVKTLDPHVNSWTHTNTVILYQEDISQKHEVEIKMAPGNEFKNFTILGFGYTL